MAQLTRDLFKVDADLMTHFNTVLADGKWAHFQDQPHIGYTTWRDPPQNSLAAVRLTEIDVPAAAGFGVAVEGSASAWPGAAEEPALPRFDAFGRQRFYVELFNRGRTPYPYLASVSAPWIVLSESRGTVTKDTRLWVTIDWDRVPAGSSTGSITVSGLDRAVTIRVDALKPQNLRRATVAGFAETGGYVSIEPEHFTRNVDAGTSRWIRIQGYGRTLSGMRATAPADTPAARPGVDAARLEYQMQLVTPGTLTVRLTLGPTLNFMPGRALRIATSLDEGAPEIVTVVPEKYDAQNGNRDWEASVRNNARVVTATHTVATSGSHTLKVWMIDPGVVLERLLVETSSAAPTPTYLGPPESPRGN
jgi:hypothetical protein